MISRSDIIPGPTYSDNHSTHPERGSEAYGSDSLLLFKEYSGILCKCRLKRKPGNNNAAMSFEMPLFSIPRMPVVGPVGTSTATSG